MTVTVVSRLALPMPAVYAPPGGATWALDRPMLDYHAAGWAWDGQPYDELTGPTLHAVDASGRREQLLVLAAVADLWQVPLAAQQDLAHWLDPDDDAFRLLAIGTER